jgi:lactoylglutathione lyase
MGARVNLVAIRSGDLGRARKFYEALGLKFELHAHGGPEHLSSVMEGVVFEIYPLGEGQRATVDARVGFEVEGVEGVMERAVHAGGRVVSGVKDSAWGRRGVLADPDGHRVGVMERVT